MVIQFPILSPFSLELALLALFPTPNNCNTKIFSINILQFSSFWGSFFLIKKLENILRKYYDRLISRKSGRFGSYLAACHDNGYNSPELLVELEVLTLCNMDLINHADTIIHSAGIFYFYTQWTFTLVTIYFGIGSSISIHGCIRYFHEVDGERDDGSNAERGSYVAPSLEDKDDLPSMTRSLNHHREPLDCRTADAWEYAFQILFQMCAGAVTLTDSVFWLIIYPFLTGKDYRLHFLVVCMHSVNAVFLLGETFLNRLRFPFFRIAYFALWTCVFVIFQWIIHACISMWWPYSFLDLSSPYAPIWYLGVGLLHLPCFAIFTLIFRIKQFCLSKINSQSHRIR
ncbi:unnamed protein product [Fraxinus pennsylvanica]|uniref:Transmembrane protein n=1 Tax=Fraxinus pennsylvanica TaxID=56036 RepID=A0AAD1YSQ6_9LAMI|nr:unnamed protein product [Fraxinus pennsylvanica]